MTDVTDMILNTLQTLDQKVERVAQLAERVAGNEVSTTQVAERVTTLEKENKTFAEKLAENRGANRVILLILTVLVAPVFVTFAVLGIKALLHL